MKSIKEPIQGFPIRYLLKPAGVIKGTVRLSEGGNPEKVFMRIAGIDRFTAAGDDGIFTFYDLAEGHYDLNIIPTLDNYDVYDTLAISVTSADTTDIGVVDLPYTAIPTVKNITVAYDTLKQWVTLRWNKPVNGRVDCFNVYRRAINPTTAIFTQLNMLPIVNTVFIDSLGEQNRNRLFAGAKVMRRRKRWSNISVTAVRRGGADNVHTFGITTNVLSGKQGIAMHFNMPVAANARFMLYNLQGKCVKKSDGFLIREGKSTVMWNTGTLADGKYFLHIKAGNYDAREPILLMNGK